MYERHACRQLEITVTQRKATGLNLLLPSADSIPSKLEPAFGFETSTSVVKQTLLLELKSEQ